MHGRVGTRNRFISFPGMPKKPVSIEVVQEGDERFLVKTYANGETVRESIVKRPRRKRYPDRPYWHWTFDKTKKKGF